MSKKDKFGAWAVEASSDKYAEPWVVEVGLSWDKANSHVREYAAEYPKIEYRARQMTQDEIAEHASKLRKNIAGCLETLEVIRARHDEYVERLRLLGNA